MMRNILLGRSVLRSRQPPHADEANVRATALRPCRRGVRMRRRELMMLLGGMMTGARSLHAQQKAMPAIGYLGSGLPGGFAGVVAAFRQGLGETGYIEGQNLAIEYRWAEDPYDR